MIASENEIAYALDRIKFREDHGIDDGYEVLFSKLYLREKEAKEKLEGQIKKAKDMLEYAGSKTSCLCPLMQGHAHWCHNENIRKGIAALDGLL